VSAGRLLRPLPAAEARALLEARGVRFPRGEDVRDAAGVAAAARRLRAPLVVKLLSPAVPHKTEFDAVRLGVESAEAAVACAERMAAAVAARLPGAPLDGFRVEEQAPAPLAELLVGGIRDEAFGPAVTLGTGGVGAELYGDQCWRLAPFRNGEAREALRSFRMFPLLDGWRGRPRADQEALERILDAVARLLVEEPRVVEVDLNPVFAYPDLALAVDARVLA
jgi:acetyl-CoA synthetase (ADP-forming)